MKISLLLIISSLVVLNAAGQLIDSGWPKYDTSAKIDIAGFSKLTSLEKDMKKTISFFEKNRARLILIDINDDKRFADTRPPGGPILCACSLTNDTIQIKAIAGYMPSFGLLAFITKDQFKTLYYAHDSKTLKLRINDTTSTTIEVGAEMQKLTLLKKPTFTKMETIIGVFEMSVKPFYEVQSRQPFMRRYTMNVFFKCDLQVR